MTTPTTILVTGGPVTSATMSSSCSARRPSSRTLDNLSKGNRDAVLYGDLVIGDTGDRKLVDELIGDYGVKTVVHFAASTIVPDSVRDPLAYYGNNTCNTRNLLACCVARGVERFVFSSTAAVYGIPAQGECDESSPTQPINPYGQSKLMSELMLRDVCQAARCAR